MIVSGIFENGFFEVGFFGVIQESVPVFATLISENLESALSQEIENAQQVDVSVSISGVDVSDLVESVSLSSQEDKITSSATIILIGTAPAELIDEAEISITAVFRFDDGTEFTNSIFSGVVKSIQPSEGSTNQTVSVYAYDSAESKLSAEPKNTSWTGTAKALVSDELTQAGFAVQDLDFQDYSLSEVVLSGFATVRDLIIGVAGGLDEVSVFVRPNSSICVRSYATLRASGLEFTTKSYTYFQTSSNGTEKYKKVTVVGSTGLSGSASGAGTQETSIYSAVISSAENCTTKAEAVVAKTNRGKAAFQTPLNPLAKIGETVSVKTPAGEQKTVRVTGVSSFIQWTSPDSSPGAWTTITGEVVA